MMWKKFLKISLVLAAVSVVTGCQIWEDFANSSSRNFKHSKWNPDTEQYESRGD